MFKYSNSRKRKHIPDAFSPHVKNAEPARPTRYEVMVQRRCRYFRRRALEHLKNSFPGKSCLKKSVKDPLNHHVEDLGSNLLGEIKCRVTVMGAEKWKGVAHQLEEFERRSKINDAQKVVLKEGIVESEYEYDSLADNDDKEEENGMAEECPMDEGQQNSADREHVSNKGDKDDSKRHGYSSSDDEMDADASDGKKKSRFENVDYYKIFQSGILNSEDDLPDFPDDEEKLHGRIWCRIGVPSIATHPKCGFCKMPPFKKLKGSNLYALMENCDHCYCLDCLRKWRKNVNYFQIPCPECRIPSNFYYPVKFWPDERSKLKIIEEYKKILSSYQCCSFKRGWSICRYGGDCPYLHMLPNGVKVRLVPLQNYTLEQYFQPKLNYNVIYSQLGITMYIRLYNDDNTESVQQVFCKGFPESLDT